VIADDFRSPRERRGFQRVFEDAGGKVVQKLFTPLNAPDYGTYISQLKVRSRRGLYAMLARMASNSSSSCGIRLKTQVLGGFTPVDRVAPPADGRRRARRPHRLLYSANSIPPPQEIRGEYSPRTTRATPASTRRDPTCPPRCWRTSCRRSAQDRGQGGVHESAEARMFRIPSAARCASTSSATWSATSTFARSEKGWTLRQCGGQDLSRRQPVLDYNKDEFEEPSLFARLSAAKNLEQ